MRDDEEEEDWMCEVDEEDMLSSVRFVFISILRYEALPNS
jgi:hypothetical protein